MLSSLKPLNAYYANSGNSPIYTKLSLWTLGFGAGIYISSYPFFVTLKEWGGKWHFSFDIKCP